MNKNIPISNDIIEEHGLSQDEYLKIVSILDRHPNMTELGLFSVLWSEHCSYKSSKKYLKKFASNNKEVLQGPGENAGIIDIGDGLAIAFKMESHNHPSAIEPYQGAATGVGGIIRDIFTMGARPVACMNSLRFGDLASAKTRYLFKGVVKGIAGYGNCIGIPTIGGDTYFYECYQDNVLVNAMCLGIVQSGDTEVDALYGPIIRGSAMGDGNPVLYVGAPTGRDGIHGATFASVEISKESEEKKSSVQVGDPFMEKLLLEACLELAKTGVIVGMQDMGAAGLTSSSSEMASRGDSGIEFHLDKVPLRETGMTPYEIMLSESQERMLIVLKKGYEQIAYDIFKKWGLNAVQIGTVKKDKLLSLFWHNELVAEIPAIALTDLAPIYDLDFARPYYIDQVQEAKIEELPDLKLEEITAVFLEILNSPNIASKKWVYEQYDHMVQTNTIKCPFLSDAAVIRIKGSKKKLALTTDCNSRYCYLDPKSGAMIAVAEATRNLAASGARAIGITDCLNFGNPNKPEMFWQFKEAIEGIVEASNFFNIPVISGNVSFYNESESASIYPTPLIGMVGLIDDLEDAVDISFKNENDLIIMLGITKNAIGGTEFLKIRHGLEVGLPPSLDLNLEKSVQQTCLDLNKAKILKAAHDVSEGGIVIALAEMMLAGDFGLEVNLKRSEKNLRYDALLFSESQSRIIISIAKADLDQFISISEENKTPYEIIGSVAKEGFKINIDDKKIIDLEQSFIAKKYNDLLGNILEKK